MGNTSYKEKMLNAIEKGRFDRVYEIVQGYPQVLDEDLAKDMQVTPLARAVWRGDFELTEHLVKMGAKIDNGGSEGITPLMWAAKRDNPYMVSNLVDFGADISLVSNEGFTALDYAVLHGNYRPALFLYDFTQHLKGIMDYYQFAKEKDYRYVNYEMFLTHLKQKTGTRDIPNFFLRPESQKKFLMPFYYLEKKLIDPVIDPRESWKKMITRIVEFEEPPMVERSDLPLKLQPQNRVMGKVRSYLNGMDPYPLEKASRSEQEGLNQEEKNIHVISIDFDEKNKQLRQVISNMEDSQDSMNKQDQV